MLKSKLIVLGIIIISLFSWLDLTKPGYQSMHDDMQFMRLYQLDKCVKDGQIPCRWVPDLGYGYGYPLFNYYPPLSYYTGEAIHLITNIGFLDTSKILFALGFIISGIGMYFLAREFWGDIGGFLSAVFYIYAPYHAVDVYVRGAMAEHWALNWFPLIFLSIYKIIKEEKFKWVVLLAFSYGLLLLSHNIMSMLFTIPAVIWGLVWLIKSRNFKKIIRLGLGALWGVGISAFFFLPVIFEKKFVHTETMTMGYFNYLSHFVTIRQLFVKTDWGWGASVGPDDLFPYMIGILHWGISLLSLLLAIIFWRAKENKEKLIAIIFGVVFLFGTAFMSHQRSVPIWIHVKILEYLQFPWRFLGLVIFFASFSVGSVVVFFTRIRARLLISVLLIIGLLFSVRLYFQPEVHYYTQTDNDRLSGELWQLSLTNAIFDYLPIYATYPPADEAKKEPQVIEGKATLENLEKGTNWQKFEINVASDMSTVQFQLYDFPGWIVKVDGKVVKIDHNNFLGLITINVPAGKHLVEARLTDTPIRKTGNLVSVFSIIALALGGIVVLKKKGSSRI